MRLVAGVLLCCALGAHADEWEDAIARVDALQADIAELIESVTPTVGAVSNYGAELDINTGRVALKLAGMGSGVVISSRGLFLTNVHVIEGAGYLDVALHDGVYRASVFGDTASGVKKGDIAVLQLHGKKKFAHSDWRKGQMARLKPGSVAFAVGNPYGHARDGKPIVTMGIITGKGRAASQRGYLYLDAIQTDAEINPGNSGGPLFDVLGNLVGINGLGRFRKDRKGTGVGYAIPIDQIRTFLREIIKNKGDVAYGYHGLRFDARIKGAYIVRVDPGSPGEKEGLARRDVVLKVNGKKVTSPAEFANIAGKLPEGTVIRLQVRTGKRNRNVRLKLAAAPVTLLGKRSARRAGEHGHLGFWWRSTGRGIFVDRVLDGTGAADAGLQEHDELLAIHGETVTSLKRLRSTLETLEPGELVVVKVARGGETIERVVELCDAGRQAGLEE